SVLIKDNDPKIESFLKPKEKDQKYSYQDEQNLKEFKEMIGGLMPWYIVRSKILINEVSDINLEFNGAKTKSAAARSARWREHDSIKYEISDIKFECIALSS